MIYINSMLDWLVPYHYLKQSDIYWKVKILVASIFFLLVFNTFAALLASIVLPENHFPALLINALGAGILILLHFKFNYKVCSNLFLLILFLVLSNLSLTTGGLSSMDLNWLIFIPIFALLLTDRISSIIWAIIIIFFITSLYLNDKFDITHLVSTVEFPIEYKYCQHLFLNIVILGIVFIFEKGKSDNILELKEQKKLLNNKKQELQSQSSLIKKKNLALNKLANQLQSVNDELEQYAHVVSHDLKQPLRTISFYIKQFEQTLNHELNKDQKEYIHYITNGTKQMEDLINSLLKHSTIINGPKKIETLDLEDQLTLVINSLRTQIEESGANIHWKNLPSQIKGIKAQIHQLFLNIISNAIKFRCPNKSCKINIDSKEMGDYWLFSISDNGIGMSEENYSQIFKPFYKFYANQKDQGTGTGIGLATCKKVVEQHQGKIWVSSQLGKGTQFNFTILKNLG